MKLDIEQAKKRFYWQRSDSYNRIDANGKPINWNLTFNEWLKIWLGSGKYDQRGPKKGQYCMSRYNDLGNYEINNVFIQQHSNNVSQARKGKTPWNKGVKGAQVAWNKGIKKTGDLKL
jgi:hypothetical protein